MSTRKLPPDYLALVKRLPLRPIRTDRDHDAAMKVVADLAVRDERSLSRGERDYLETLSVLLEDFDRREAAPPSGLDGVDLLRHLMEANDLSVSDLARIIGNQSTASLILNRRREMSKSVIQMLADYFGVNPGLFLRTRKEAA